MIGQLLGPVAGLASSWLDAKTTKQAAEAKLKLTEAEAKAKILLSEKTSVADWERIMAENSKSSWKDEFFVIVLNQTIQSFNFFIKKSYFIFLCLNLLCVQV